MSSTATVALAFKKAFHQGIQQLFVLDSDTEAVLVTYGAPANYSPPDIVSFLDITSDQAVATIGASRSRDESLALTVSISCVVAGGQEAELAAAERAYDLLRRIEYWARRTDTTIGGTVRECFLEGHSSSGQTDPALMSQGRVCEIVATFRARARITN